MKILVLIPARLESTRLPKKPLININGKSMIETVYNQIKKCKNDLDIMIATDSKEIYDHTTLFNAKTIMTNKNHISGTDRCNEVVSSLNIDYDLIINVQADEPLINPKQIDKIIDNISLNGPHQRIYPAPPRRVIFAMEKVNKEANHNLHTNFDHRPQQKNAWHRPPPFVQPSLDGSIYRNSNYKRNGNGRTGRQSEIFGKRKTST